MTLARDPTAMSRSAIEAGYSIETSVADTFAATGAKDALTVTRANVGSVRWMEPVDLRHLAGADISKVVRIERGAVIVYDEDCGVPAPMSGEGLKKRVEVTLWGCLPRKRPECPLARERYGDKVVKQTRTMGAELLEYSAVTGTWRFAIQL